MKMTHLIKGILAIMLLLPLASPSQTVKILYVSPDSQTGPEYDKIRSDISNGIRDCLQEKWIREIKNTTWERSPNKKKLLESYRVNYVLKLDDLPIIKGSDKQIQIAFELMPIDKAYQVHDVRWNNSSYMLVLNDRKEATNVNKVVNDVCDEIDFYLNSSDDLTKRKFRPRIKINGFEAAANIEDVNENAFRKWLNTILEDKYAVEPNYVFYFSRKYDKQYPENSSYQISGVFSKYGDADDKLVRVLITIDFPEETGDTPLTVIHSEEFSFDDQRKKELVKNIITVLEEEIHYYGEE